MLDTEPDESEPDTDEITETADEPATVLACAYPADLLIVPVPGADPIVITTEGTEVASEHLDAVRAAAASCAVGLRTR